MIAPPEHWTTTSREGGLLMVSPSKSGVVKYVERARPLRAVNDIIRAVPEPPGWVELDRTSIERLVTNEGEYGAFVAVRGTIDGVLTERSFGFVFGDDCYAMLAGVCRDPAEHDAVRDVVHSLAKTDALLLGPMRRRRFIYTAPASWSGVGSGFHTNWFPPGYPRDLRSLLVMPAVPTTPGLTEGLLTRAAGVTNVEDTFLEPPQPRFGRAGLSGQIFQLQAPGDRIVALAVLNDDRFTYAAQLHSSVDAYERSRPILEAVLDSIESIPRPGHVAARESAACMTHWTE